MISKLKKLEAKLSFVDVEDLYTLTIYSSDLVVIRYLQKFIVQYAEYFNISEIFKDNATKKQSFVAVLIQKLFEAVQRLKSTYLTGDLVPPSRSEVSQIHSQHFQEFFIKRKVIFNICEALRICFREMVDFLSLLQHCQLLYSLTFIISQRFPLAMDYHKLVLSAYRTLVNVLNKSPERIEVFLLLHDQSRSHPFHLLADLVPLERFIEILYNRMTPAQEALAKQMIAFTAALTASKLLESDGKTASSGYKRSSEGKDSSSSSSSSGEGRSEGKADHKSVEQSLAKMGFEDDQKREESHKSSSSSHRLAEEKERDRDSHSSREEIAELILEDLDFPSTATAATSSNSEVQLLNYVVKILYMIACQSDKAKRQLQSSRPLLQALIYRLSRSLISDHHCLLVTASSSHSSSTSSTGSQSLSQAITDHSFSFSDHHLEGDHNTEITKEVKMRDFPYSSDNFTLITTISKLLYLLDVYSLLEEDPREETEEIAVDSDFIDFFVSDHQLHYHRKRDEIETMDEIVVRMTLTSDSSSAHHLTSFRSTHSNNTNNNTNQDWPSNRSTASERQSRQSQHFLSPLDLLNFVIVIVLTIGPYDCSLYLTDAHQENISSAIFYTGQLFPCEEAMLQLLMLSSDRNFSRIFSSSSAGGLLVMTTASTTRGVSAREMALAIISYRQLFLSNSLIRILILVLQRSKANKGDLQEKSALLCPILIAIIKVLKSDERSFQIIKRLIFPTPFPPTVNTTAMTTAKEKTDKPMHAQDCPENSLRHSLVQLMTSFDTTLKRCVAEALFLLCHENKEEFMYRTGFGNAIALLQTKGLV